MNILLLISIIFGITIQNIFKKEFNKRSNNGGVYFFSCLTSIAALIFFLLGLNDFSFEIGLLPYSLLFGLSYVLSTVFSVLAISHGSVSLTALIISYSLMIPTVYGILFLNEPIGYGFTIGIILLVISLSLVGGKNDKCEITPKWILYVFIAFVTNGMCSVSQKMQQVRFDGAYKNEFMIVALLFVVIASAVLSLFKERSYITEYFKKGWFWSVSCGTANGMVNLFVMILSGIMATSVMFPSISAGGIILTFILSTLIYKERFSVKQLISFCLGTVSVIFLNI